MADVKDLGSKSIETLNVSAPVKVALKGIQAELLDAYRESFVEMIDALKGQASALNRIQTTLNILVEHLEPQLKAVKAEKVPVAFSIAGSDGEADLAKAVVVADPIGAGYTLSQSDLARALGISQGDASVLVRAFKLTEDGKCAVRVRKGATREMINYHPSSIERFRKLVESPPAGLKVAEISALKRVRKRMAAAPPGSAGK